MASSTMHSHWYKVFIWLTPSKTGHRGGLQAACPKQPASHYPADFGALSVDFWVQSVSLSSAGDGVMWR
jgi:hypothetical protein